MKNVFTPAFDQTTDRQEIYNLDPTLCDFGKFANDKVCRIKKSEAGTPVTPVVTVGYVVAGYVATGYFATQAA